MDKFHRCVRLMMMMMKKNAGCMGYVGIQKQKQNHLNCNNIIALIPAYHRKVEHIRKLETTSHL